jgi:hypothetical protein
MIEPIGTSLLLSGTSLSQSGARRQPVLWRSPDPWSSPDISTFDGDFALSLRRKITSVTSIFLFEILKLA